MINLKKNFLSVTYRVLQIAIQSGLLSEPLSVQMFRKCCNLISYLQFLIFCLFLFSSGEVEAPDGQTQAAEDQGCRALAPEVVMNLK